MVEVCGSCCSSSLTGDQELKPRAAVSVGRRVAPLAARGCVFRRDDVLRATVGERVAGDAVLRGDGDEVARAGEWPLVDGARVEEEAEMEVGCWQGGMKSCCE